MKREEILALVQQLGKWCGTSNQPTEIEYALAVFHDALVQLFPDEQGNRVTYYDEYEVPSHVRRPRLIWKP